MYKISSNYSVQLNKNIDSVGTVNSGDVFEVETINAYGDNFKNLNELMDLISGKYSDKHHHPLTGPIDINGTVPGDVLKVEIKNIKMNIMAQALSQSAGISPIKIDNFGDRAPIIANYDKNNNDIYYMNGIHIDYKPMIGVIGTAPNEGFIKTGHAGKTGGNLDIPFVEIGNVIYLPVKTEGGKLFLGDCHGNQGYGELGGIALEASANLRIKVDVLKPRYNFDSIVIIGKEPMTKENAIGIVGIANSFQNLSEAVVDAYNNAINVLVPMFPTLNKHYICNLITAIGHSMNGQAFSKTSESTSIINILEKDIRKIKNNTGFDLACEFEKAWFKKA